MARLFALCALAASALGQGGSPPDPRYPGARQLCAEHVSSREMHLSWESYATPHSLDRVVGHFQRASGRTAETRPDGSGHFDWDGLHKMSIYPAARNDDFPNCDVTPTPKERTVILSSTAARLPDPAPSPPAARRLGGAAAALGGR